MKIKLVCIGKLKSRPVEELVALYSAKIAHYYTFELSAIPDVRMSHVDELRQKELEGQRILAELAQGDSLILLDERGRLLSSREFSDFIDRKAIAGVKRLVFVIGGPYGFDKIVYDRADGLLSLSKMTLPHELARLFTVEQIYRAGTILRGEPYHHD